MSRLHILDKGDNGIYPQESLCGLINPGGSGFGWYYRASLHDRSRKLEPTCIICLTQYRKELVRAAALAYIGGRFAGYEESTRKLDEVRDLMIRARKERPDHK